jgi:hypothetical protein
MQLRTTSGRFGIRRRILGAAVVSIVLGNDQLFGAEPPLPPAVFDVPYAIPAGRTIAVAQGESLQAALDQAELGDTIVLEAGATYAGPITLSNKTRGSGWIYVQSSALARLPPPGSRVSPANAGDMPVILSGPRGQAAILTAGAAHHYRFVGIEVRPAAWEVAANLIRVGDDETSGGQLPSYIVFDRCYVHADPSERGRRGIAMEGTYIAVVDSHLAEFKENGLDSQALWASNTPGPLKIVNNYLEAAGENVMLGGSDPAIPGVVPSDVEIRGNTFFKQLAWQLTGWTVKNLLEIKNAQRVLVTRNVFENSWVASQSGFAVLVMPTNQDGAAPWAVTADIDFDANVLRNVAHAISISGQDTSQRSDTARRIRIRDNLVDVRGHNGFGGRAFQLVVGPDDVTIDHNTVLLRGAGTAFLVADNAPPSESVSITNNVFTQSEYGAIGSNATEGLPTLDAHFRDWSFVKNVVVAGRATVYPSENFFPSTFDAVGFEDPNGGNYRLSSRSPYRNLGTDGRDLGADFDGAHAPRRTAPGAPTGLVIRP